VKESESVFEGSHEAEIKQVIEDGVGATTEAMGRFCLLDPKRPPEPFDVQSEKAMVGYLSEQIPIDDPNLQVPRELDEGTLVCLTNAKVEAAKSATHNPDTARRFTAFQKRMLGLVAIGSQVYLLASCNYVPGAVSRVEPGGALSTATPARETGISVERKELTREPTLEPTLKPTPEPTLEWNPPEDPNTGYTFKQIAFDPTTSCGGPGEYACTYMVDQPGWVENWYPNGKYPPGVVPVINGYKYNSKDGLYYWVGVGK